MSYHVPELSASIERRLLISYRVDPHVAQSLLPGSLRPKLVDGSAVAGVCLLRLGAIRPAWVTRQVGWRAENAAHRISVEWDDASGTHSGVYLPERHSASWLPVAVGGRVFPGVHKHARFDVTETDARIRVAMTASDTRMLADVSVRASASVFSSALFESIEHASAYYRDASVGWSPSRDGRALEGLQLQTDSWRVQAGEIDAIESSFFDALPKGSAVPDSVLVMRGVPIRWVIPGRAAPTGRSEPDSRLAAQRSSTGE